MLTYLLQILLFMVGIAGLYWGAEWLVTGAGRLARVLGMTALVIGLTVVAFGTSAPELVVGVVAAAQGDPELALGNVIGSNVMNIALILGISALVTPIAVGAGVIRREIPLMIGLSAGAGLLGIDGDLGRGDGLILLVLFFAYIWIVLWSAPRERPEVERSFEEFGHPTRGEHGRRGILLALGLIVLGIVVMFGGARALVTSAVFFAREFGLPDLLIGLTVVAIGTSLPELATCVVAAYKKKAEIAVGNIVGSNIFNLCAILGASSLVAPIPFAPSVLRVEYVVMFLISLLLLPLAGTRGMLSRREGVLLLTLYVAFTALVIARGLQ